MPSLVLSPEVLHLEKEDKVLVMLVRTGEYEKVFELTGMGATAFLHFSSGLTDAEVVKRCRAKWTGKASAFEKEIKSFFKKMQKANILVSS